MTRESVSELFEQMALLLELKGANPFKVRAYQNGARALEGLEAPLLEALQDGSLKALKGIGAGLLADIRQLADTGVIPAYEEIKAETPPGLLEMLGIPGFGPKKVRAVHEGLGISSVGELEYACLENRLVSLPGFGEKTQTKVLKSIEAWKKNRGRFLLSDALSLAEALLKELIQAVPLLEAAIAGSVRRRTETVQNLDFVAASPDAKAVLAAFGALEAVEEVLSQGDNKTTVRLKQGLSAELHVVPQAEFPYCLFHFTGSKSFNAALGQRAKDKGLKLNEYGLWDGEKRLLAKDEQAVFNLLGLDFVPPELREDKGEIEWAANGTLPALISEADLQGVFHVHTHASDGAASIREMALKARSLGLSYVGISDHSEAAFYAQGLKRERIVAQQAEIVALNEENLGITIFSGIEADILADGTLDYDAETLRTFDFVIGSIHSRFNQDAQVMTARLIKALENPALTMLGHLSGRLLLSREPYAFDLEAVLKTAAREGKIIELNANPHRLDLDWRHLARAKELGVLISINPDAHSVRGLEDTRYGVAMARKGALGPQDIFNTLPLETVRERFRLAKARSLT
jgi:DNA polymerase (family 10)